MSASELTEVIAHRQAGVPAADDDCLYLFSVATHQASHVLVPVGNGTNTKLTPFYYCAAWDQTTPLTANALAVSSMGPSRPGVRCDFKTSRIRSRTTSLTEAK